MSYLTSAAVYLLYINDIGLYIYIISVYVMYTVYSYIYKSTERPRSNIKQLLLYSYYIIIIFNGHDLNV